MSDSRTKNTIRNSGTAIIGHLFNTLLSFVSRTIFIYTLGKSYLGVHGLFSNILTVLSLAELGIGDAITYKLYKPLAENDHESVNEYISFYKRIYTLIGLFVLVAGLGLTPFLDLLIKDPGNLQHISLIYVLYLIDTASTYFFAHKKLIIKADQKNYVLTINRYIFLAIRIALQIAILLIFKSFILYLSIQIIINFAENIVAAMKSSAMYPYTKEKASSLGKKEKREVFKQTSALVMHKIGGVCVSGTDNILISSFVGLDWVGIYSNYITVLSVPVGMLSYIFSPLTATVGNLITTSKKEHIQNTFNKMFLVNFWLYGFCAIALFCLINPLIGEVWLDDTYLLNRTIVLFIVFNFYLTGMRQVVSNFKYAAGLFWNDRFRPLCEAAVNIVASIILLKHFGFVGVIAGTTISTLTTTFWVEAFVVYKRVLGINPIRFLFKYAAYLIVLIIVGAFTFYICELILLTGLIGFILKGIVCVLIANGSFLLLFCRTAEFKSLWEQFGKKLIRKRGAK